MDVRMQLVAHLKRHGHTTVPQLRAALGASENAVRHHLARLERDGFVRRDEGRPSGGRPAVEYALTDTAEGLFPKQYRELLELVLGEAQRQGTLDGLLRGVGQQLGALLRNGLPASPDDRVAALRSRLDLGAMMTLDTTAAGWELEAYNCPYRAVGQKFEAVCDLVPRVIGVALGQRVDRPQCQRDGALACHFSVARHGEGGGAPDPR